MFTEEAKKKSLTHWCRMYNYIKVYNGRWEKQKVHFFQMSKADYKIQYQSMMNDIKEVPSGDYCAFCEINIVCTICPIYKISGSMCNRLSEWGRCVAAKNKKQWLKKARKMIRLIVSCKGEEDEI